MDVVALGELLIDFTENGVSGQGNPLFEANPGGAPCNVLAMLSRLGHRTAFIGKVGNDFFGKQLEDAITEVGIDAAGLLRMIRCTRRWHWCIRIRMGIGIFPFTVILVRT